MGILVGWALCIVWLAWIGFRAYRKEYKRLSEQQGPTWHPNGEICKDGHKWCEEHAKKGQFHCTVCPYAMTEN